VEDPALTRRLLDGHVPLTVCPLSNVRLRVFPSIEEHPAKQMPREGLRVTLNSDDPAYFGGYAADNYSALRNGLDFDHEELASYFET
jgi:adenosine deaminase